MADQELILKIKSQYQDAGLKELKQALKDNTAAMDEMKRSGQQGSQQWNDAKAKAAALTQAIKETTREYKGLEPTVKASGAQLLEFGENLTVVLAGIKAAVSEVINLGKSLYDLGQKGAEFQNLKNHFNDLNGGINQANDYLAQLNIAASGNLNDEALIKFSNKMLDLGYSTDQTTQILDLSERKSDELGTTIEEANSKILAFIETGRGKGLKEIGVSVSDVTGELKKLAVAQGLNLKDLDDEALKRLRSQAILTLYGKSVDEISKKEQDNADKMRSLSTAFENAKIRIGEMVSGVLSGLATIFGTNTEKVAIFITILGGLSTAIIAVGTAIKLLSIAFAGLNISTGGLITIIGALVSVAALLAVTMGNASVNIAQQREELLKSQTVTKDTKSVLDELNISANNMAEAYKGIEDSIYGMSEAQTKTAIKFVQSEIAKIQALKEEGRQMDLNTAKARGLENYDIQNQTHQLQLNQYEDYTYGANLEKLNGLLDKLNSKQSLFDKEPKTKDNSTKSRSETNKEEKEELSELQKLDEDIAKQKITNEKIYNELISKGYSDAEIKRQNYYKNGLKALDELEKKRSDLLKVAAILPDVNTGTNMNIDFEKGNIKERNHEDSDKAYKNWEEANKNLPFNKALVESAEMAERIAKVFSTATESIGSFFGAMASGKNAGDAFKQLLKGLAMQLLDFLQVQYFASTASTFFKAIFTAGATLTSDLVWQMLGFTALQAAKGLIGALAGGGAFGPGTYLVGEQGPELMTIGGSGFMMNNRELNNLVMAGKGQQQQVNNIMNFGVDVDWIKVRQASDRKYSKYKNSGRL